MSPIKAELLKTLQPKTALGKKLWEIRQRSIAEGTKLLTEPELEQELADRRGGC